MEVGVVCVERDEILTRVLEVCELFRTRSLTDSSDVNPSCATFSHRLDSTRLRHHALPTRTQPHLTSPHLQIASTPEQTTKKPTHRHRRRHHLSKECLQNAHPQPPNLHRHPPTNQHPSPYLLAPLPRLERLCIPPRPTHPDPARRAFLQHSRALFAEHLDCAWDCGFRVH